MRYVTKPNIGYSYTICNEDCIVGYFYDSGPYHHHMSYSTIAALNAGMQDKVRSVVKILNSGIYDGIDPNDVCKEILG